MVFLSFLLFLLSLHSFLELNRGLPISRLWWFVALVFYCNKGNSLLDDQEAASTVPCPSFVGFPARISAQPIVPAADTPKVRIFPPFLDFGERPIFSPLSRSLTISNRCNTTLLEVFPPFSSNLQFYSAARFKGGLVEPNGEISISIVFLPSALASIQGVLIIQTSAGGFLVRVQGTGTPSPYKVARVPYTVPAGQSFHASVTLHNPFAAAVSVSEVRFWPADPDNRTLVLTNPNLGVTKCCSDSTVDYDHTTSYVSIKPAGSWVLPSGLDSEVVELEFRGRTEGRWNGFLYIGLSSHPKHSEPEPDQSGELQDQLLLPFDVKVVRQLPELEPVPDILDFGFLKSREEKKRAIYVRNTGHEIVRVVRMEHSSSSRKNLVAVRYRKGLVIYPGTQVQVGVAWYRGIGESLSLNVREDPAYTNLEMVIHTNGSLHNAIRVPYHAVVLHESEDCADSGVEERVFLLHSDFNLLLSMFQELEKSCLGEKEVEKGFIPWGQIELNNENLLVLTPSTFLKSGVLQYSAVQVNTLVPLWINITNPYDKPVNVQLFLSQQTMTSNCRLSSSNTIGFLDVFTLHEDGISQTTLGAFEEAALGPLMFNPKARCSYTSLIAMKNNLTMIEWFPVHGVGSSGEISFLENSLPLEQVTLSGNPWVSTIRSGVDENLAELSGLCKQRMNRSFLAKNTGEFPLKVHSVGFVNGQGCRSRGFELSSCDGFELGSGEATQMKVFYSPDYTSANVRHHLQLVTSIGVVRLPVLAVLPDHMLRLCGNVSVYLKYKRLMLLMGFMGVLFMVILMPGSKRMKVNRDCDGRTGSLPLFREASFEASSTLSKIRVKVTEEVAPKDEVVNRSSVVSKDIATDFHQVSSPRKTNMEKSKRKRKKGLVSSVKHEATSSPCSSSPASSPATTPLSSQRPVSPLSSSDEGSQRIRRPGLSPFAEATQPAMDSRQGKQESDEREVGGRISTRAQAVQRCSAGPKDSQRGSTAWVRKDELRKLRPRVSSTLGEWVTVARTGEKSTKKKSPLTTNSNTSFQLSPSCRAPGSKILKNSEGNDLDDSGSSCNTSSRFSDDIMNEQVYDIWGDHLGEISRQSNLEAQSLFSAPLKLVKDTGSPSCSDFSMFSGNVVAAFHRAANEEEQEHKYESFLMSSPFDLSDAVHSAVGSMAE